ncbi:hypothetical protein AB0939_29820 [Streptomyces sp. NPDC006990]
MSENEKRLAEALRALRQVTSGSASDDRNTITAHLDAIEVELERITESR